MLIHAAAFNLGLLMRRRFGIGIPRTGIRLAVLVGVQPRFHRAARARNTPGSVRHSA